VLAVITTPSEGRAFPELEPHLESDDGRRTLWIATRILPPRPQRAKRVATPTKHNRQTRTRAHAQARV
jgi:hypothetical protein